MAGAAPFAGTTNGVGGHDNRPLLFFCRLAAYSFVL